MSIDPLSESLRTLDQLAGHDAEPVEDRVVEHFLLRTGRPLPRVVVLGRDLAGRCRQVDAKGGDSVGVGGHNAIRVAHAEYPGGTFVQGDLRNVPVERNAFDGVWLGDLIAYIPHDGVAAALASVHAALRPGGLLYVRLADPVSKEETSHGPLYRVERTEADLAAELSALDFSRVEHRSGGLIFRREY